jgi:hypothetical protein
MQVVVAAQHITELDVELRHKVVALAALTLLVLAFLELQTLAAAVEVVRQLDMAALAVLA